MKKIIATCATLMALIIPAHSQATAIKSEFSGKCLTYGDNPTQTQCSTTLESQNFDVIGATMTASVGSPTAYQIRAGLKCLHAPSAAATTTLTWATCVGTSAAEVSANQGQFWRPYKNGSYTEWQSMLSTDSSQMCMSIKGGSLADFAFYELRSCSEGGGDIFSEVDITRSAGLAMPICSKGSNVPGCTSSTKLGRGIVPADIVAKGQACDCTEQYGNYCMLKSRPTYAAQCKTASQQHINYMARLDIPDRPVAVSTGVPNKDAFRLAPTSGPITATKNMVIKGKRISNVNGACITIPPGVTGVRIQENEIGPCGTSASVLDGAPSIDVQGQDVIIERNVMHDSAVGVYANLNAKSPLVIDRNRFYNNNTKRDNVWIRGQAVQFNGVSAGTPTTLNNGVAVTRVTCNVSDMNDDTYVRNFDDHFNFFNSRGTQTYPIEIALNRIRGGVSESGSGIMVGDGGGAWYLVHNNALVLTSNTGIGVAGGSNITIRDNRVWNRGANAASKTSSSYMAQNFEGPSKPTSNILFLNNRGVSNGWLYGGTGELSLGFGTPPIGQNEYVNGLTLTGNQWQDTSLTSSIFDTSYTICNNTQLTAAVVDTPPDNGGGGDGGTTGVAVAIQDALTGAAFLNGSNTGYRKLVSGPYYAINDVWAWDNYSQYPTMTADRDKIQQTGISTVQADGSVSARVKWYYKYYPQEVATYLEVMGYPAVVYGHIQSQEPVGGAKLPLQLSALTKVKSTTAGVTKNGQQQGQFHVSYDVWINDASRMGSDGIRNNRRVEIMMPIMVNAGYGLPTTPAAAVTGRDCSANGPTGGCAGRGARYVTTTTIDGVTYDIHYGRGSALSANGSYPTAGLAWDFVVFIPKVIPMGRSHTVDWMKIINMLKSPLAGMSRAVIESNNWYLGNVSVGGEPIHNRNQNIPAQADVTIGGFKVEVN